MKLTCIIIDDEAPARKVLINFVNKLAFLDLLGDFEDAIEALNFLHENEIDFIFLDIKMPKISGIQFIKSLISPPKIIIASAYPEYAVEGFELAVSDYLLKPFSFERFVKSVEKVSTEIKTESKQRSSNKGDLPILLIKADKKLYPLAVSDILYLEAYGDYVKIFRKDKKVLLTKETLKSFAERLPGDHFIRVHRSFLVSKKAIHYVEGNFVMIGKVRIPVSQNFKTDLLKDMQN